MSFYKSARGIMIVDNHILKAFLAQDTGEYVEAEYDLDEIIGNRNGQFTWGGVDFSSSASDVTLSLGADPILRATLINFEGNRVTAEIDLSERIGNEDGEFVFSG
ncbi:hypothetical protein VTI28DRAFT_648 [Corynascus sepedonium]